MPVTTERRVALVTLLLRAANEMIDELVRRVDEAGYPDIRPSDSRVFENLDPGGTRLTELAARARMAHQSMGELVAGLEQRGYLERCPDPADGRARLVRLTPHGRAMMQLAMRELAAIEADWLERLSHEAGDDLHASLLRTFAASGSTPADEQG